MKEGSRKAAVTGSGVGTGEGVGAAVGEGLGVGSVVGAAVRRGVAVSSGRSWAELWEAHPVSRIAHSRAIIPSGCFGQEKAKKQTRFFRFISLPCLYIIYINIIPWSRDKGNRKTSPRAVSGGGPTLRKEKESLLPISRAAVIMGRSNRT